MTNEQIIERIDYIQNSLDVIKQNLRTHEAFKAPPIGINPVQCIMWTSDSETTSENGSR